MKIKKCLNRCISYLCFIIVFQLFGGVILADKKKDEEKPPKKIKASVAFGLDLSQGNTVAFGMNASLNINWKFEKKTEINFSSSFNYLETDGEKKADKMYCQLLFDHFVLKKTTFFLLAKPSRNQAQEIDFRLETGGGFKYDIIDNYSTAKDILNTDLSFSAALIYEFTNRFDQENEKIGRLSLRPKFKQQLSENLEFKIMFFYQPNFADFTDYRLLLDSEIRFKISKSVFYLFKFIGEYNNVVPADVKKQDLRFLNQLSIDI
jgi:hypothetical protein